MTEPDVDPAEVSIGTAVFSEDGRKLGTVRGVDDDGRGLLVSLRDGFEAMSASHVQAGGEYPQAELTWGCYDCGEIRRLEDALPENCPDCGAAREKLYYRTED